MEQLHSEKNRTFYIKNINDYCERMHPTQKKRFLICFHLHKIERKNSIGRYREKEEAAQDESNQVEKKTSVLFATIP